METDPVCKVCNKTFSSHSNYYVHKREKHTFANTVETTCICCLQIFNSVMFNKARNKSYDKCEKCRDLQKLLRTNNLIHNTYVYGSNKDRYHINFGEAIKNCNVYDCQSLSPCQIHSDKTIVQCNGTKCNNCFVANKFSECDVCRQRGARSKDNTRSRLMEFKIDMGGECVDCGCKDMFVLEFDHKDPTKKKIQITRSSPNVWDSEKYNLELRCGRCHRIKSIKPMKDGMQNSKCKEDKKAFVRQIKQAVGKCQVCDWRCDNVEHLCVVLDFDHITGQKYKQVSNLYLNKRETIAKEIAKTRLICRHCHELYTCLQRGGKALKFYYTPEQIEVFKKQLCDDKSKRKCQQELLNALNNLGYNVLRS